MRKLRKEPDVAPGLMAELGITDVPTYRAPESLSDAIAMIDEYRTQSIELRMILDAIEQNQAKHNGNGHGTNGSNGSSAEVESLQVSLAAEQAVVADLRTQLVKAHGAAEILRNQIESAQAACEQARQELGEEKARFERLREEFVQMRTAFEERGRELEFEREAIEQWRAHGDDLEGEIDRLMQEIEAERDTSRRCEDEVMAQVQIVERLRSDIEGLRENVRRAEAETADERSTNNELRAQIAEYVAAEQRAAQSPVRDLEARLKSTEMELYLVQQRNAMMTAKLAEAEQERDRGGAPQKAAGLGGLLFGRKR